MLAAAAVALAAWVWYFGRGGREATTPPPAAAPPAAAVPAPLSASQVQRGIERAQADVQKDPQDAAAWAMLAHSSEMAGRFDEAGKAYQKLLALRPQDAQAHADYADALGVANKGSLRGEPARLITRALELEPTNLKALVLAGKEAFERGRYADAVNFWQRALKATQDPALRAPVQTSIAEAQALMSPGAAASSAQPFVTGRVTVAAALKDKVGPDDTVFIFARAPTGSRMPLAILRKKVSELPLDFKLDDSLAMSPAATLSGAKQVVVGARVSKSGTAVPQPGDFQVLSAPMAPTGSGLNLEIAEAVQ